MLALIQRVSTSRVEVNGEIIAAIDQGITALVAVEKNDNESVARRLSKRILNYRIFSDPQNKMNLSVRDIEGALLLVPQFTLAADTKKGMRPSFSCAAEPGISRNLFEYLCRYSAEQYSKVAVGRFGADMQVTLCNDGPVTFLLKVNDQKN